MLHSPETPSQAGSILSLLHRQREVKGEGVGASEDELPVLAHCDNGRTTHVEREKPQSNSGGRIENAENRKRPADLSALLTAKQNNKNK